MKKTLFHLLSVVISLSWPLFVIGFLVSVLFVSDELQSVNWALNDIEGRTGLNRAELTTVRDEIQDYVLFNADKFLQVSVAAPGGRGALFNEREILHMRDVKELVHFFFYVGVVGAMVLIVASVLGAILWRKKVVKLLYRALTMTLVVVLPVLAVLGTIAAFNFNWLFTRFHILSFANNLWMLNPNDYLLRLFPQPFWLQATVTFFVLMALMFVGAWLIARFLNRRVPKPPPKP